MFQMLFIISLLTTLCGMPAVVLVDYCVAILLSPLATTTITLQSASTANKLDTCKDETAPNQLFIDLSIRLRYHHQELTSFQSITESVDDFETKWR